MNGFTEILFRTSMLKCLKKLKTQKQLVLCIERGMAILLECAIENKFDVVSIETGIYH